MIRTAASDARWEPTRAKPYRWRGIPGWNPAALGPSSHEDDIAVPCPQCKARAGQNCRTSGGRDYEDYETCHSARRQVSGA